MELELGLAGALGVFFLTAAAVVVGAVLLAVGGDVIADRTGLGRMWVGWLLVAGATSLPELVTNVAAVRIDAPSLAAGDIFGANMLNMSNLAILIALLGGSRFYHQASPRQAILPAFAVLMTGVATLFAALRLGVGWGSIGPGAVAVVMVYVLGSWLLYRSGAVTAEAELVEEEKGQRPLWWGWLVFLAAAAVIFVSAPFLASSAQRIAEVTGIAESFIGVLAVAFVTTLPELVATGTALRIGARDLAIANMYGSNAFNIAILGVAELFYTQGFLFAALDRSHVIAGIFAVVLMGMGILLLPWRSLVRRRSTSLLSASGMAALYLVGLWMVFRAG